MKGSIAKIGRNLAARRGLAETGGYEVYTCMYRDVTVDRWLCIFDVLGR
jgi:hypothetical protein